MDVRLKPIADPKIYGKEPLVPVRVVSTIKDMFESSCEIYADNTAFLTKPSHSEPYKGTTYKEYKKDVYAFATALYEKGLEGKKIAIIGENRYEWAVAYMAIVCGVGTVVPLDKELSSAEIRHLLEVSKTSAIIYTQKTVKKREDLFDNLGDIKGISIDNDMADYIKEGNELLEKGDTRFKDAVVRPEDVNILLFTSGTTGNAKGVMLSHKNIASNLMNMVSLIDIRPQDRFFSVLPIHHTYECTCGFLCPFYRGSSIAYCEGLRYISANLKEAKPSIFLAVPLIVESIYKNIKKGVAKKGMTKKVRTGIKISNALRKIGIDKRRSMFKEIIDQMGGNIRLFIVGAASVDDKASKDLSDMGIYTIQGYGLTECSPIAAVNRESHFRNDSAGLPPPEIEIKTVDVNDEGIGELCIKGDNVTVGYYENPELTAETIVDGWFHTGDLGYIKDGFIYITGRKKDVIITSNGKNVFPDEIEKPLGQSPYVAECMVYALDTDKVLTAQIYPDFEAVKNTLGENYSEDDLKNLLEAEVKKINENLAPYKHVLKVIPRDTEFIKTTTRKIKRYANIPK